MPIPDDYLGDGVYVRDEGFGVSLDTRAQDTIGRMGCPSCDGTGHQNDQRLPCVRCAGSKVVTVNRIVLESPILAALSRYIGRIEAAKKSEQRNDGDGI